MNKKRVIAAALTAAMLLPSVLSGCSESSSSSPPPSSTPSSNSSSPASSEYTVPDLTGLEINFLGQTRSPYDPEQTLIWDELESRTGAKLNYTWVAQSDYTEKVNTILASAELPDVIFEANMATLLDQGAIIPLDDLLNEYGSNITRYYTTDDYLYLRQISDGKIYHVPYVLDFPPSMSTLVRQDWIDKLGLEQPKTYDEWKAVWQAFKDNDCNGDGDPTNEIPILCTNTNNLLTYTMMFGIKQSNSYFAITDDGLISIFEHPNFRLYLNEMADLYAKGILDREFATRANDYKTALDSGLAGFTIYFAERARLTTDTLKQTNPDAKLVGVEPVVSQDGQQLMIARTKIATTGLAITIEAEKSGKAEKIMQFYNYVFSDEGNILMNYGIEGKTFDYVNGDPVIKSEIASGGFSQARASGLICTLTPMNFLGDSYMQLLLQGSDENNLDESTQYFYDALYLNTPYFYYQVPIFSTEEYLANKSLTEKLDEAFANAVSGNITVDEFFTQYQKIKDLGWQSVIDSQNAAYQELLG